MKWFAPDFYPRFACIGGKCRHSCCIGWEIDIDPDSLARYQAMEGPFGQRLRQGVSGGSFRMDKQGRCVFLNQEGLCEMILHLGEESLCQICADHPRFRNHYTHRTELGLGLCCEEAARLTVLHQPPMKLVLLEEDGQPDRPSAAEKAFLARRAYGLELLQNRRLPLNERLRRMLFLWGASLPKGDAALWASRLSRLERLDDGWLSSLHMLSQAKEAALLRRPEWERAFEQLACYFVYRHLAGGLQDGHFRRRALFCAESVFLLRQLCAGRLALHGAVTLDDLAEFSRQYSAEIEYSQENLEAMFRFVGDP